MLGAWLYPKQPTPNKEMILETSLNTPKLGQSIYATTDKIAAEKTTIVRKEKAKNYFGLIVADKGYFYDLFESYDKTYYVKIRNSTTTDYTRVGCIFNKEWGQKLKTLEVPTEILFEGVINDYNIDRFELKNCILK